jgi:cob(I)alamin adenosyltransferase
VLYYIHAVFLYNSMNYKNLAKAENEKQKTIQFLIYTNFLHKLLYELCCLLKKQKHQPNNIEHIYSNIGIYIWI